MYQDLLNGDGVPKLTIASRLVNPSNENQEMIISIMFNDELGEEIQEGKMFRFTDILNQFRETVQKELEWEIPSQEAFVLKKD